MRGETHDKRRDPHAVRISIHSPHAGRDDGWLLIPACGLYFNPLSPCGERLGLPCLNIFRKLFQSTLPMRGETLSSLPRLLIYTISIHSPHAGRDVLDGTNTTRVFWISIHSPHAGRDSESGGIRDIELHFNPLSPCGERLRPACSLWYG